MKRHFVILALLLFALCLSAQDNDSILLERTDMLKKEIGILKKNTRSLQVQINKIQKAHKADMQDTEAAVASLNAGIEETRKAIAELEKAVQKSEESSLEGLAVLGDWTKKMITVLAIVLCILFILLLIMVITSRSRLRKDFLKLEARVENVKESMEVKLNEALKKHEEDMLALTAQIEKGKK